MGEGEWGQEQEQEQEQGQGQGQQEQEGGPQPEPGAKEDGLGQEGVGEEVSEWGWGWVSQRRPKKRWECEREGAQAERWGVWQERRTGEPQGWSTKWGRQGREKEAGQKEQKEREVGLDEQQWDARERMQENERGGKRESPPDPSWWAEEEKKKGERVHRDDRVHRASEGGKMIHRREKGEEKRAFFSKQMKRESKTNEKEKESEIVGVEKKRTQKMIHLRKKGSQASIKQHGMQPQHDKGTQ